MTSRTPPTATRVERHSPELMNEAINAATEARVRSLAHRVEDIEERLADIDHEWDVERTLEANAAIVTLLSTLLGTRWRIFRFMPVVVAGFLLQHAIQGWCPPVPIFRRFGVRTMKEIDRERYSLKALRGDFGNVSDDAPEDARVRQALDAADYGER